MLCHGYGHLGVAAGVAGSVVVELAVADEADAAGAVFVGDAAAVGVNNGAAIPVFAVDSVIEYLERRVLGGIVAEGDLLVGACLETFHHESLLGGGILDEVGVVPVHAGAVAGCAGLDKLIFRVVGAPGAVDQLLVRQGSV